MNYKPIVINSYDERYEQSTSYSSYFKREALLARRDNFVEFEDFFNGCLYVIDIYECGLIRQYEKELTENDLPLYFYKQAIQRGETLDDKGEPIQNHIDSIVKEKKRIESNGYKNNYWYFCLITKTGDIAEDNFSPKFRLYWPEIEEIKQGILQAQNSINISLQPQNTLSFSNSDSFDTSKENNVNSISYKQYTSIDEALNNISTDEKIILHTLMKYSNPAKRSALDLFNDILYVKANYKKSPQECYEYLKKSIDTREKEFYAIIHILRNSIEKDSDLLVILPEQYENSENVQTYIKKENQVRKQLTVHFDLKAGALLKDPNNPNLICTTHNITDELALYHLTINPECKNLFSVLPENLNKLLEEYQNQNSVEKKTSKKQSIQQVKERRTYNFEELKSYFKSEFWKPNDSYVNYFDILVSDLKPNRIPKEFAEIALMIYESKFMNDRKPVYFKEWYKIFCECVDSEQKKYNPKDLRSPGENLKKLFSYLLD